MNGVQSPTVCFQEMGKILKWAEESGGNLLYFAMGLGGNSRATCKKYEMLSCVSIPEKQSEKKYWFSVTIIKYLGQDIL